jgi:glycosyltransferase involved in cell wall biosynthesis
LEHAIFLIDDLRERNIMASLKIMGDGSKSYYDFLQNIVVSKNLENQVHLIFKKINYDEVYEKFNSFNIFLITSSYEGGPNVGLEAMAYGMPILSFKVGAMTDRLRPFSKSLLAENASELVDKAAELLRLSEFDFLNLCFLIKNEYKMKYSNKLKFQYLNEFLSGSMAL